MAMPHNPAETAHLPRVGVGVLILDHRSRALLTLRKLPPEAGSWSIVGGKLEYLETLHDCALREALEEVGVATPSKPFSASPTISCPRKASTGFPPLIWAA